MCVCVLAYKCLRVLCVFVCLHKYIYISILSGEDATRNSGGGSGGSIWLDVDSLKLTGEYTCNFLYYFCFSFFHIFIFFFRYSIYFSLLYLSIACKKGNAVFLTSAKNFYSFTQGKSVLMVEKALGLVPAEVGVTSLFTTTVQFGQVV